MSTKNLKISTVIFNILCLVVVLFGGLIMLDCLFNFRFFLIFFPDYIPIEFNTAVCFVLTGLALVFNNLNKNNLAYGFSFVIFIISTITVFEYFSGFNLFIDEIFISGDNMSSVSYPGRMALNSAICFLVCSVVPFLNNKNHKCTQFSSVLGSFVFGLGFVAFVGYFTSNTNIYAWGQFSKMSLIGSVLFIIIGICISLMGILSISKQYGMSALKKMYYCIIGYNITLAITLSLLETQLPNEVSMGILYIVLIPFGWFVPSNKGPLYFALVASFLCVINPCVHGLDKELSVLIINRLLAVLIIGFFSFSLYYLRIKKGELNNLNNLLNNKIIEKDIKSKELEQFVYAVTHDLKEPLRSMSILLDVLSAENKPEEYKAVFEKIKFSSIKMSKSIQSIVDYSNMGHQFNLEEVNSLEVLNDIIADLPKNLNESDLEINVNGLSTLKADKLDFRILFEQLIGNAIKFKKENEKCIIKIWVENKDHFWKFFIQDNGIGIAKKNYDRIFQIFQSLERNETGLGVGLAHCRKIVSIHGGEINVDSQEGIGSTFSFTISKHL